MDIWGRIGVGRARRHSAMYDYDESEARRQLPWAVAILFLALSTILAIELITARTELAEFRGEESFFNRWK